MKHESNDTPPFAPDAPISRSLFVRPNLIERLCASALRLCLLVCIPAAASVFLISLADSAEAACTSEPSQHYEVTTLIADHPVQTSSDPDFEEILKANARIAVESGEWSRRVKRKEETLIQWMRSPVFPEFRPMAVKTTLIRRPTGLSVEDIRRAELFNDVSRLLLFFDSRAGGQVNFARGCSPPPPSPFVPSWRRAALRSLRKSSARASGQTRARSSRAVSVSITGPPS